MIRLPHDASHCHCARIAEPRRKDAVAAVRNVKVAHSRGARIELRYVPHLQGAQVGAAGIEDVQLRLYALQRTPVVIIAEDGDRASA